MIDTDELENKINNSLNSDLRILSKESNLIELIMQCRRYPFKVNRELLNTIRNTKSISQKSTSVPNMINSFRVGKSENREITKSFVVNGNKVFILEELDKGESGKNSKCIVARSKKYSTNIKKDREVRLGK